jgi:hypothetical protein
MGMRIVVRSVMGFLAETRNLALFVGSQYLQVNIKKHVVGLVQTYTEKE